MDLEHRLAEAQEAFRVGTDRLRLERQQVVMEALAAGWSKYKIAAVMGIKGPSVDSIIKSAERKHPARVLVTERNPHLLRGERAEGILVVPVSWAAPVPGRHW